MMGSWGHWTTIRYGVACFCSYKFEGLSCIYNRRSVRVRVLAGACVGVELEENLRRSYAHVDC